ncbi:MAG: T9SS type A sorting domain-containing protein, partial [Bacteroidia bacterium]|nr:T9SS type A sorting domain-containing protein [Bacteroidia bacterium]
ACTASVIYPRISAFDNCGNVDIQLFEGLGENGIFPAGTTVERWVATDGSGNSDTLRFEIQVLTNPAKPAFDTLAVVETLEDSDWISVHLTHIYDGLDCEDSPLEFSLQPENELLFDTCQFYYVTGNDSALLLMLPAPDAFGDTKAVIKVTNPETGLEYSDTLIIRITPVNDPPFVVRPLEDLQTRAGDTLKMVLIPEQGYYFDDIDDETLQLSLKMSNGENIPGWLQFRNDSILTFPAIADTGCINVILVATDLAGEEVYSPFTICIGFPVGIQTLDSQNLKVYPNPTTGKVYVDFLKNTGEKINISVVNYLGQEVLQKIYQGEERLEIDLTGKSSGMYIIRAKGKDFDANFRIILKPLR